MITGRRHEEAGELFNKILGELETSRELMFLKKFYVSKKIRLNKTQVRSMIKKWPASPRQTMKIDEVISDIMKKISERENGVFHYKCAVTEDLYELVISQQEIFFHDVPRGIFYTFEN